MNIIYVINMDSFVHETATAKELRALREALKREKRERCAERAGRTKAERRLRELEAEAATPGKGGSATGLTATGLSAVPSTSLYIVGHVGTPFPDRRGVPRQPMLCPSTRGCIRFCNAVPPSAFEGLDAFSHIWVVWLFHENTNLHKGAARRSTFSPAKVAPPQNGGRKVGVFACRTPHRPNPIGLSVVKLDSVDAARRTLHVSGIDFVDGTPILDIKPFLPLDVPPARSLVVPEQFSGVEGAGGIARRAVVFSTEAEAALLRFGPSTKYYPEPCCTVLRAALEEMLALDIRARRHGRGKATGGAAFECAFDNLHLTFTTAEETITIVSLEPASLVRRRVAAAKAAKEEEEEEEETAAAAATAASGGEAVQ